VFEHDPVQVGPVMQGQRFIALTGPFSKRVDF